MEAKFQYLPIQHPKNRPALRGTGEYFMREVRGIIIHWTANEKKGADAKANWNYFNQGAPGPKGPQAASAHYIVDDKTIIQCLPETEVAFHCGDTPYKVYEPDGLRMKAGFPKLTPNFFTIGIEMCVNAGSNWDLTYQYTVGLTAELMQKYPTAGLYRHYDITGKACPKPLLQSSKWKDFWMAVWQRSEMLEKISTPAVVASPDGILNVRTGPASTCPIQYTLLNGERVLVYDRIGNWSMIGNYRWVNNTYLQPVNPSTTPV